MRPRSNARSTGWPPGRTTVIHGGARGADHLAGRIAALLCYAVEVFGADWRMGRRASSLMTLHELLGSAPAKSTSNDRRSAPMTGLERNIRMLDSKPDLVLAFWDGQSGGTAHTIAEARRRNIPVVVMTERTVQR